MIRMFNYIVTVRSDAGAVRLQVKARNKRVAGKMVMAAEHCPQCAIESIKRL